MTPDMITGAFEFFASIFILSSIVKLNKDKLVAGVSYFHAGYFAVWGIWNLFFFPYYSLWWAFTGGCFIVTANIYWLGQLIYYTKHPGERNGR